MGRQNLYEDVLKASEHRPDYFILATTGHVGASTKDWINSQDRRLNIKIALWERTDIEIMLERHQDLRLRFLQIRPDPDYVVQLGSICHNNQRIDHVLMTSVLREVFGRSCKFAVDKRTTISIAVILWSLLTCDRNYTRLAFLECGLDPEKVCSALFGEFLKDKNETSMFAFGLRLTSSAKLSIEVAISASKMMRESILSERFLLYSLLVQPHSPTMAFLVEICSVNFDKLKAKVAIDCFPSKKDFCVFGAVRNSYSSTKKRCDSPMTDGFLPEDTEPIRVSRSKGEPRVKPCLEKPEHSVIDVFIRNKALEKSVKNII